ncbi:MAG: HD domain-containing phosphohydrolase, partial [Chloroflexota bacterium]
SGLYAPMKAGEETLGAIGVESETGAAFDADDERLLTTLASQSAAAIQTARQFETTRRRAVELETLNRVSVALRAVTGRDEMLAIVLEETLNALGTAHGSINLWDEPAQALHKVIARGWLSVVTETPIKPGEGIFGSVFASGKMHLSQDFSSDPLTREETRAQLPAGWGGACAPINSAEQTLGVLLVALPSGREFTKGQVRLLNTIAEMTGAALHRVALHQQTVRRLEDLQSLHMIDQAISSSFDLRPVLEIVVSQATSRLGVDAASLLLLDPPTQTLRYITGRGFYNLGIPRPPVRLGQGLAGRAALERALLHASNLAGTLGDELPKEENFEEYYVAPLVAKGEVKGVLEVFHRETLSLDKERLGFLETLAGQAAIALDNSHLFDGLQRANLDLAVAYDATIEGWSRALDLRDEETEGHTQRVTALTLQLAQTFGLAGADLNHVRRGALLHDIGKMGIPDSILLKPGPLTDEEWVIMRQHPHLAYELLAPITYLRPALDIPWCHHEKWDGTGYPRKLKDEQIPLAARIFAVVDVYDALTSDRPYRKAWTKDKTLQYIAEQSGAHFDPQVVERFMQVIAEQG